MNTSNYPFNEYKYNNHILSNGELIKNPLTIAQPL